MAPDLSKMAAIRLGLSFLYINDISKLIMIEYKNF